MYQVHSNIPVPVIVRKGNPGAKQKYNFADLKSVGDSLQIPMGDFKTPEKAVDSLRSTVNAWKKRNGATGTYQVAANGETVGVWLTKVA